MKEIEAKTENRYEYRKPQEKRKHMIAPDLFEFAYVPDWYGQLEEFRKVGVAGIMEIQKAEPRDKEHSHTYFGTVHTYNFSQTGY